MRATVENPNPYLLRFQQLLTRSALVARRYVEAEGLTTPLSDAARERAQNVLGYTLKAADAWAATRDLLLALAPKMEMAGYRSEWLPYLADGVAQSQRQGDQAAEAALQFQCGYLYRLMSNYAAAHRSLNASAAHYAALGDAEGQARALNQLAYLAWQQHRYDEAITLAQQALLLVGALDVEKATSLSALGLVAIDRSQWQEAAQYHKEALHIRTYHAQRRQMAWSLQNLALALRGQQEYEKAIAYYEEAIAILDEVHDPANRAIVQMNLGIVYYFREEFTKALAIYRLAETSFHQFADDFNLGKVLTNQGLGYLALQQWSQAESAFTESMNCFQKLADRSMYLNALDGLGITYLEQHLYDKALVIFESVQEQLADIIDTPAYHYLAATISVQLEQAHNKVVERGLSTWKPPKRNN
jgi:tetratricopeptide (TPR) repeat protein